MTLPEILSHTAVLARGTTTAGSHRICEIGSLRPIRQHQTYWCWAAVLQELSALFGSPTDQCAIAESLLEANCDCGALGTSPDPTVRSKCNDTFPMGRGLATFSKDHQREYRSTIEASDLCQKLTQKRPVVAQLKYGNQSHYCLVKSVTGRANGSWAIELADPQDGDLVQIEYPVKQKVLHPRGWTLNSLYLLQDSIP